MQCRNEHLGHHSACDESERRTGAMVMLRGSEERFREKWASRLGSAGVEEAVRYRSLQSRARTITIFGGALLAVGIGLPNVPVLCAATVLLLSGLYIVFGPAWSAQRGAQRAACQFQGLDQAHASMLTLQSPTKFDSQAALARRIEERRRHLGGV